jgi:hypothetical protein
METDFANNCEGQDHDAVDDRVPSGSFQGSIKWIQANSAALTIWWTTAVGLHGREFLDYLSQHGVALPQGNAVDLTNVRVPIVDLLHGGTPHPETGTPSRNQQQVNTSSFLE